ncbi:MAG: DUF4126 domain-containing protein [Casimicrobiaceae bacterium]|nr:DUF4126 domain-containing protein [Casimicrobiaceae bacterium]
MEWFQQHLAELAMALAMAWGAGLRLYLVVFVVGLLGRLGYIALPETLAILANPVVLAAAGFMTVVEFFADKVPWVDSLWDAVHTFLRIPAGAALAAGMLGDSGEGVAMAAALIGGTLAAGTHLGKAGTRATVNTSPEPVSNVTLSVVEDSLVVGGLTLAIAYPLLFLGLLALFVLGLVLLFRLLIRGVRALVARLFRAGLQPSAPMSH